MADVEIPRRPLSSRDLQERRPIRDDYRSPSWRAEREGSDGPAMSERDTLDQRSAAMNAGTTVNMRRLQEHLARRPLEEIATLVHGLTFGEMMEFAEGVWSAGGIGDYRREFTDIVASLVEVCSVGAISHCRGAASAF
jgi:hypothetical protein